MRQYYVERTIKAPPSVIWTKLTDAKLLANGAFGILRLEGTIAPGEKLKLWSSASPGRAFVLSVSAMKSEREMVWCGGLPLGLFTGRRVFTLIPEGAATRFSMCEVYSGPLASLIWKTIPDLTPTFQQFAEALADAVETRT